MINNVNRTFTTTPLLVISRHLLNVFVLVDILAEGERSEPPKAPCSLNGLQVSKVGTAKDK